MPRQIHADSGRKGRMVGEIAGRHRQAVAGDGTKMTQPAIAVLKQLLQDVCREDGTSPELVLGFSQASRAVASRRKFARRAETLGASQRMIGIALGRDHTSVHHLLRHEGWAGRTA